MTNRRLTGATLAALLVAAAPLVASPTHAAGAMHRVSFGNGTVAQSVSKGATKTVQTDLAYVDLVVGDPEIADVMPLTDRSFYVHGKKIGMTTVTAYDAQRRRIGAIDLEVGYSTGRLAAELRKQIPNARIKVSSVNGRILLSGEAPDAVAQDAALTIAHQFGGEVLNQMKITSPQQVMLEVRFLEASRQAGKELGVKWDVASKRLNASIGASNLISGATPFGAVLGQLLSGGTKVDVLVQALEGRGLARRLAEPNLTAMSGQTASFLAGGEFPFPVAGANGAVSVEFKKFGVGLSFTPTVLANGVISLKIEPEVSQIDVTNAVSIGGISIPSLVVRRVSTNVELKDGQSFALAGLLQSVSSENINALPWINDVPVIGALFRSTAFERRETELAVIVTPHLVRPTRPGQKLRSPLDATVSVNDVERFLLGKQEIAPADLRVAQGRLVRAGGGHILDLGGPNAAGN
ncbi:MAG: type II and III secretion system protein family protein [Hyphomicrobiales bacterium]|nr:type II and III secretion system protein family protein [Hyphomicrobiales bacterium]